MRQSLPDEPVCTVLRTSVPPALDASWRAPEWADAEALEVSHFHARSSDHRPRVHARMLWSEAGLHGIFHVEDRYVIGRHLGYQAPVYQDSCVEFFVQPKPSRGYMNFEMNCCGALLTQYIEDPTRTPEGFARFTRVPEPLGRRVEIHSTLAGPIEPEIEENLEWTLSFRIPLCVLEAYVGPLGDLAGQVWRANFNKCADRSSHPHWATWAPMGEALEFHAPALFGLLWFS